jgi:hypothetical protein
LERFAKFPIATTFDEKASLNQPRLILVSVDVAEGTPVVFDSYDGGVMSNTPLTQVVRLHREYWLRTKSFKDTVPRLNIFIVNVHPL